MKISEVKALDDRDIIPEISGTLVAIYEQKTGEGNNGAWSLQNCELEDDSGDRIKLVLSNRPNMPQENKGRSVTLRCYKGDKGKSGLYATDDTYKNITTRKIRVTGTGRFLFDDEGSVSNDPPPAVDMAVRQNMSGNGGAPRVFGATIGMAINNAVGIIMESCEGEGISYYKSEEFASDLHQIASALVRVSQQMEAGNLWTAPVAKDNVVEVPTDLFQTEVDNEGEEWK